jgi:hypothetical protein
MEKIPFELLGLTSNEQTVEIVIGDKKVQVLQYLPVEKKSSLVNIVLQEAIDYSTGMIDKVKGDALFWSYVVAMYTDIQVDSNIILDIYDIMESNGVIDAVISAIPEDEYDSLVEYLSDAISDYDKYKTSVSGIISQVINDLPNALKIVNESLGQFDGSKFSEVVNLVKTVGGNEDAAMNALFGQK